MRKLARALGAATLATLGVTVFFHMGRSHSLIAWPHVWSWSALGAAAYASVDDGKNPLWQRQFNVKKIGLGLFVVIGTEIFSVCLDPGLRAVSSAYNVPAVLAATALAVVILDTTTARTTPERVPGGVVRESYPVTPVRVSDPLAPRRPAGAANIITGWSMGVLALGGLYTLWFSRFVPSRSTLTFSYGMAVLAGLIYGAFTLGVGGFGWDPESPRVMDAVRKSPWLRKAYLRVPLMSLVFAGFSQATFSDCVPAVLNAVSGSQGTMTLTVSGWRRGGYVSRAGWQCPRPTVRELPDFLIPLHAMCPLHPEESSFPVGARIVLHGRASVFGISPTSVTVSGN